MMEMVGGVLSIIIGVIMLIIGGSILNTITTGSSIGNCDQQDYNGDGNATAADKTTTAYLQCNGTRNNGFTILNIISVMMIIGGVIVSVRGFTSA